MGRRRARARGARHVDCKSWAHDAGAQEGAPRRREDPVSPNMDRGLVEGLDASIPSKNDPSCNEGKRAADGLCLPEPCECEHGEAPEPNCEEGPCTCGGCDKCDPG